MKQIEQAVLLSAITKKANLFELLEYDKEIFQNYNNRKIYEIIIDLFNSGKDVSVVSLHAVMIDCGLEKLYIEFITESATSPSIFDIRGILDKIKENADKEKIKIMAKDIYNLAMKNDIQYEEFIDKIYEIKNNKVFKNHNAIDFSELHEKDLDEIFNQSYYIPSGFRNIDDLLHGFFCGNTYIIAARPGQGKSAIAMQIARQMNTEVLFFSLEMRWNELYARYLSNISEAQAWKIEAKKLSSDEFNRVLKYHKTKKEKIIVLDDQFSLIPIISMIKKFHAIGRCRAVIIDYIQLISGADGENMNIKLTTISRMLKNTAMSLNIPIIFLSQLNRNIERTKSEPTLADLRDSGSLEQDSTGVIFLHRKDKEDPLKIIIAKNRKGKIGIVEDIEFEGPYVRFLEKDKKVNPEWFNL